MLPAAYGHRLSLSVAADGDPAHPEDWRGKTFLQVDGARLASWSSLLPQRPFDVWGRLDLNVGTTLRNTSILTYTWSLEGGVNVLFEYDCERGRYVIIDAETWGV